MTLDICIHVSLQADMPVLLPVILITKYVSISDILYFKLLPLQISNFPLSYPLLLPICLPHVDIVHKMHLQLSSGILLIPSLVHQ